MRADFWADTPNVGCQKQKSPFPPLSSAPWNDRGAARSMRSEPSACPIPLARAARALPIIPSVRGPSSTVHLSHTATRSKRSQPSPSQCPLSCPIRWLVQQSNPHDPLCAGCRSHVSELSRSPAHSSCLAPCTSSLFLAPDSNTSRAHIRRELAMGLKTRPRLVAELFEHAEEKLFTHFAHPLASAKTSPRTRTRAACSGARILLRLRVRALGPPGPWLRLWVWAPGPPSHRHSQLWLSELRPPFRPPFRPPCCPVEPPGHLVPGGRHVGPPDHSGLAGHCFCGPSR